jgi:hypothetical protein
MTDRDRDRDRDGAAATAVGGPGTVIDPPAPPDMLALADVVIGAYDDQDANAASDQTRRLMVLDHLTFVVQPNALFLTPIVLDDVAIGAYDDQEANT